MTTITISLRPSLSENSPGTIVYRLTRNESTMQIRTAHKLFPYEWDSERSKVIVTTDERLKAIDRQIRHEVRRLERIIRDLEEGEYCYTAKDVATEFLHADGNGSLFRFMDSLILRHWQLRRKGTAKNYYSTLMSVRQFRLDEDVELVDVDCHLIEDYIAWLREKNLTPNTISFYIKILRAAYNRAVECGLTRERKPFRSVCTTMEKTSKRALSIDEIKRIRQLDLSKKRNLQIARDVFLFLFYCRGMSFVDAAYLKKNDISYGILSYRRRKTGQLLRIKVVPEICDIVERYARKDTMYLLPIIFPFGDDRKQYEAALHRINKSLKIVGRMAKLQIPLTTYVSRHSWATIAKRKNIPIAVISEALGHESETTTKVYLSSIDPATIDSANSLIIDSL